MCYLMSFAQRWSMVWVMEGYWDGIHDTTGREDKRSRCFGHTTRDTGMEYVALALALGDMKYSVLPRYY
jgi:hypothetical protein